MVEADHGSVPDAVHHAGIAVLIDGENINATQAEDALRDVEGAKDAAIRRVYGNARKLARWSETPGFRVVHTDTGKNSADIRLAIDAVHISHTSEIWTYVIITSDSDFSHLAHHLRERQFRVIGIGEDKTPKGFRATCSQFIEIRRPGPKAKKLRKLNKTEIKVRDVILAQGDENGLAIQRLGGFMNGLGIKISTFEEKTWRVYLMRRSELFSCDPKGPKARVRWIGG